MFEVGDIIFYPVYGPGHIDEIRLENIYGKSCQFYVIKFISGIDMMIPVDSDKIKKIRRSITANQCEEIFNIFQKQPHKLPKKWGERFKVYNNSMREGNIYKMAEILRDISAMAKVRELSKSDLKAYEELLYMVSGEISMVLGKNIDDIKEQVNLMLNFLDGNTKD